MEDNTINKEEFNFLGDNKYPPIGSIITIKGEEGKYIVKNYTINGNNMMMIEVIDIINKHSIYFNIIDIDEYQLMGKNPYEYTNIDKEVDKALSGFRNVSNIFANQVKEYYKSLLMDKMNEMREEVKEQERENMLIITNAYKSHINAIRDKYENAAIIPFGGNTKLLAQKNISLGMNKHNNNLCFYKNVKIKIDKICSKNMPFGASIRGYDIEGLMGISVDKNGRVYNVEIDIDGEHENIGHICEDGDICYGELLNGVNVLDTPDKVIGAFLTLEEGLKTIYMNSVYGYDEKLLEMVEEVVCMKCKVEHKNCEC